MMNRHHTKPLLSWFVALVLVLVVGSGCSKVKDMMGQNEEPELTLEEEREVLEVKNIAKERFEAKMAEEEPFNRRGNLKQILLTDHKINLDEIFPAGYDPETLKTRQEVDEIIKQRATSRTEATYSDELLAETKRLAAIEYPLIEVGDEISITTVRNVTYSGEVEAIYALVFQLGERELLIKDVQNPDPGCFHKESCEKLRDYYVRANFLVPKKDEFQKQLKMVGPATLREFGFVRDGKVWRRMDAFIERHVEDKLNQLEANYTAAIEARVRQEVKDEMLSEGLLDIEAPVAAKDLVDRATGAPPPPVEDE